MTNMNPLPNVTEREIVRVREIRARLAAATPGPWQLHILVRLGSEEFGLILPNTAPSAAQAIVMRLASHAPNSETVSAGIAEWGRHELPAQLLERADAALYEAKRLGRARVVTRRGVN